MKITENPKMSTCIREIMATECEPEEEHKARNK